MNACRGQEAASTVHFCLLLWELGITHSQYDFQSGLLSSWICILLVLFCMFHTLLDWDDLFFVSRPFIICKSYLCLHLRIPESQFKCNHYWLVFVTQEPSNVLCKILNSPRIPPLFVLTVVSLISGLLLPV